MTPRQLAAFAIACAAFGATVVLLIAAATPRVSSCTAGHPVCSRLEGRHLG